ncbi:MAG: DegT/DnrJ/EryC1/StrS family aminotransferase [Candidatus Margulisbacteria bacterium]|nr:DegT/DnrJ/EryC1/StrS family aminotransferase [Candidatus Margulisiibacteriota bacterium]
MPVPFFDIKRQISTQKAELLRGLEATMDSGAFILGPQVEAFEAEFAAYCGTRYAVGVASGTDALLLALLAAGIKAGDEIVTSPFTFVATAEAINYIGAKPVFADIDPRTFNLDPTAVEKKITKKTKAILPVHIYGQACRMDKIVETTKTYNLALIEDCAQATGAEWAGKKVGSFGLGAFSFFPTKNLGCFGDGGAVTTNDENIAKQLKILRNHGTTKTYHHDLIGYNSRLDALQAGVLRPRLNMLDGWAEKRRNNANKYRSLLKGADGIALPYEDPSGKHTYNQFVIKVKDRDKLFGYLQEKKIGCMVYYPLSLHLQKAFEYLGHKKGDLPNAEKAQDEVLALPIFPELTDGEIEETASAIKEFFKK